MARFRNEQHSKRRVSSASCLPTLLKRANNQSGGESHRQQYTPIFPCLYSTIRRLKFISPPKKLTILFFASLFVFCRRDNSQRRGDDNEGVVDQNVGRSPDQPQRLVGRQSQSQQTAVGDIFFFLVFVIFFFVVIIVFFLLVHHRHQQQAEHQSRQRCRF